MKKLLAIFLAVLTVFSFCSLAAFAEDASEPGSEPAEPEVTTKDYEICEDADFLTINFMSKGNDKATILHEGDTITTYKNSDIDVLYYADADAMYNGEWKPADQNNLAFSPTAEEYYKETFKKAVGKATIRGLDYTDFTIAYSDENVFVGWVIYSYEPSLNTIKLVAVWEKNHKITTGEKVEDMYYIVNFFFSFRKAWHDHVVMPMLKVIRVINNAFLFVKTWLYDQIFGQKAAA
ncbi:MAG: hypothetical protein IJT41_11210 [Clostridia bacterium]|nr:hypothetical protein [Clostridia bacterium]